MALLVRRGEMIAEVFPVHLFDRAFGRLFLLVRFIWRDGVHAVNSEKRNKNADENPKHKCRTEGRACCRIGVAMGRAAASGCRSACLALNKKACGHPDHVHHGHACERRGRRSPRPRRARSPSPIGVAKLISLNAFTETSSFKLTRSCLDRGLVFRRFGIRRMRAAQRVDVAGDGVNLFGLSEFFQVIMPLAGTPFQMVVTLSAKLEPWIQ